MLTLKDRSTVIPLAFYSGSEKDDKFVSHNECSDRDVIAIPISKDITKCTCYFPASQARTTQYRFRPRVNGS